MEKITELSKPVAYKFDHGVMGPGDFKYGTPQMHSAAKDENASSLYSQEYVSVLLARIEELEKKETWRERQSVIDGPARSGEAWADIEEYMEKWDAEHLKTMKEQNNG